MSRLIQDPQFPGLPAALDVPAMLDRLRGALPECRNGLSLLDATIVDVRYRPGGPCWILYNLKLRHGDDRSIRQLLSGRVLMPGEMPEPLSPAILTRYATRTAPALHTPIVHLPDIPMVAYAFPLDASLPGLLDATDPAALRHHLNELWAGRKVRVRRVRSRVLGYTPHARAAFAYEVLSEARDTGTPEIRRLVGKMHAKKTASRLFADAWAVWQVARGRVNLAPPVGYLPGVGLTLQETVPGERLGGLVERPEFTRWVRQSARMLAHLHALDVPLASRRKAEDEVQSIHRWAGVCLAIRSDLAARVERLRDRIASEVAARAQPTRPIHADFHHTNILVDHDLVTFIDFDETAIGDPMLDVGRFLASLRIPARRAFGDFSALREAGEAFLETYFRQRPDDARRARLFEAASLLVAAASAFRIQRLTWSEEVEELIAEAERVLALSLGSAVTGPAPAREPLSREERTRWSADEVFMQATLAPHIRRTYGAEPTGCRVRRSSDEGDGARITYTLRGTRGEESWRVTLEGSVRSGGGGRGRMERLRTLRQALEGRPGALRLPMPVATLSGLALSVYEPPPGERLSALLDGPEALVVAERLAEGLHVLHGAAVDFGSAPHSLTEELPRLRRQVEQLAERHPELGGTAAAVLAAATQASERTPVRFAPTIRGLHPRHVLWDGEQVGVMRVEDVGVSDPLEDVAAFLARCVTAAAIDRRPAAWDAVATRFRDVHLWRAAESADLLAVFEATALLRLACGGSVRRHQGLARQLVETAEARLAVGGVHP